MSAIFELLSRTQRPVFWHLSYTPSTPPCLFCFYSLIDRCWRNPKGHYIFVIFV